MIKLHLNFKSIPFNFFLLLRHTMEIFVFLQIFHPITSQIDNVDGHPLLLTIEMHKEQQILFLMDFGCPLTIFISCL